MNKFKKLIYQSCYRSTKEADILLSSFARTQLENLSFEQLNLYEKLIDNSDEKIRYWISNTNEAPNDLQEIITMIKQNHANFYS